MVSMKKLKKTLRSMKKFITNLTHGKRERPSKQELKEAKRRKLEERNSLISRESSSSDISAPGDSPNGSAQANSSSLGGSGSRVDNNNTNSMQTMNSDEFFAQILSETGETSNERAVSFSPFDPFVEFDPFTESTQENWINFDDFATFPDSNPEATFSELFDKDQPTTECNDPWLPSSLPAIENIANSDVFSNFAEPVVERVSFSENDNLVGMIPRYKGVLFLPDGDISDDIMNLSKTPQQELSETKTNQLLPMILLTPPEDEVDDQRQPPQVVFEGIVHPQPVTADKQNTLVHGCNPLLELSDSVFADKLSSQRILLEYCMSSHSPTGLVRVDNLGFEKYVFARISSNGWRSFRDVTAEYVSSTDGFTSDRFCFKLPANTPLEFALCYQVNSQTYWDNNDSRNYSVL